MGTCRPDAPSSPGPPDLSMLHIACCVIEYALRYYFAILCAIAIRISAAITRSFSANLAREAQSAEGYACAHAHKEQSANKISILGMCVLKC